MTHILAIRAPAETLPVLAATVCACGRRAIQRPLGDWCTYCHRTVKPRVRHCQRCPASFPVTKGRPSLFCPTCRAKANREQAHRHQRELVRLRRRGAA